MSYKIYQIVRLRLWNMSNNVEAKIGCILILFNKNIVFAVESYKMKSLLHNCALRNKLRLMSSKKGQSIKKWSSSSIVSIQWKQVRCSTGSLGRA